MKLFDPHIHLTSRTTDDYQNMYNAGIRAVVEPAFWVGQPRTHVGTFEDYFLSLMGWERFRSHQFGIHHFCTLAMNPKEANDTVVAEGVLKILPTYLSKESVVAVGEIGLDEQTPMEEKVFALQLEMAKEYNLPALVHTPHRDKKKGTLRCLDIVRESKIDPNLVLIDHNTEDTIKSVVDRGYWAGHSIYPETKMDENRMVKILQSFGPEKLIVNSAADWGVSDPLMVPKTYQKAIEAGISSSYCEQIFWQNPYDFFAASGKFATMDPIVELKIDQKQIFEGSSVLRGQTPQVEL